MALERFRQSLSKAVRGYTSQQVNQRRVHASPLRLSRPKDSTTGRRGSNADGGARYERGINRCGVDCRDWENGPEQQHSSSARVVGRLGFNRSDDEGALRRSVECSRSVHAQRRAAYAGTGTSATPMRACSSPPARRSRTSAGSSATRTPPRPSGTTRSGSRAEASGGWTSSIETGPWRRRRAKLEPIWNQESWWRARTIRKCWRELAPRAGLEPAT